ncbi:MAG: DUF58 domain-containing protein [Bacteroidia bacterium]
MKIRWNIYLCNRFFYLISGITAAFAVCFAFPVWLPVVQAGLVFILALTLTDVLLLFRKRKGLEAKRLLPRIFSLGSQNHVRIEILNDSGIALFMNVVDEIPVQFQNRNFSIKFMLSSSARKVLDYTLRPLSRGEYQFQDINIYTRTILRLAERKHIIPASQKVPVYPSVIEMKNFELKALSRISNFHGIKKLRRLGQSYEFEQIKNYVMGDDYRSINWKATSRKAELMVNQFEEERAQQIYSVLDTSRSMKMPFGGLSLLDYAINTSLVISNIAISKQDRTGLLAFSDKIDTIIKADKGKGHLKKILEGLYKQEESSLETNYELLYLAVRNTVRGRSLLFLYTNFESYFALERALPIIRKLNKIHLLVVVFFENTEVAEYSTAASKNVEEIYLRTIAQKYVSEKKQIVSELRQYGIQAILTRPEDLSINTVNKYLELKSRGMI